MLYVDTSVLVAVLMAETHSDGARDWLYSKANEKIAVSVWTRTEFSSALSLKVRTGQIDVAAQGRALTRFGRLIAVSTFDLAIMPEDFLVAARWCDNHRTGLRAGDALHMAIAHRNHATLCTLDGRLHEA